MRVTSLVRSVAFVCSLFSALPASASVTATFWNHELGESFPHAFVTLRGVPDAGGAPVDYNVGFTAKSITPALLFGPVPGRLDYAWPDYIQDSTAQFSIVLTDAQYAAVLRLAKDWDDKGPESIYDLKTHNCIHFVAAIEKIAGLSNVDFPNLVKKPRSYLLAVAHANAGHVTVINRRGKEYLDSLR